MRLCNLLLLQFAWYDLFDLVLQAQRYFGYVLGVDGRRWEAFATGGWQD
jgi:hypothetical protein